jgi:uncharacterized membrane protein YczE
MLSILLLAIGTTMIIFGNRLSELSYKLQKPLLNLIVGGLIDLDKPWVGKLFKRATLTVGCIFIILGILLLANPISY